MNVLAEERDARGVVTLVLNRPDQGNRLSGDLMVALRSAAERLGADDGVRVVVLTGGGEAFCAGGDRGWMQAQIAGDAASRRAAAMGLALMLQALNLMPKPLIGRVNGGAVGGGIGLISVCDVAIGVTGASFGLTETRLGLIPATISPYVLARIGAPAARRYLMASRMFDASVARDIGLLAEVVPQEQLDDAVEAEVLPYLACAPGAVAAAKALIHRVAGTSDAGLMADTVERLVDRWANAEAAEGIAAMRSGRKPAWED